MGSEARYDVPRHHFTYDGDCLYAAKREPSSKRRDALSKKRHQIAAQNPESLLENAQSAAKYP